MNPLTLIRAAAWLGVGILGWSLNLRWGTDTGLPPGPPATFERAVVGAALLAGIAALALSIVGHGGTPPGWLGRALALAGSAGAVAVALYIRSQAPATTVGGPGWPWTMAGAGVALGAAAACLALRSPAARPPVATRRRANRRAS